MNNCFSARRCGLPLTLSVATGLFACSGLSWAQAPGPANMRPVKVLLCTGDYGMWAQDRVPMIENAVEKSVPGKATFSSDQSYNFVQKMATPGYLDHFDVVACGDVALGQMTTEAQANLVDFVRRGGGFVYVVEAKSTIPFYGPAEAEPMPLAAVLPYQFPKSDPVKDARPDAHALTAAAPLFAGLDLAHSPFAKAGRDAPLVLERNEGKGRVAALYGALGPKYTKVAYATYKKLPDGWDEWPDLGALWARVLDEAGAARAATPAGKALKTDPYSASVAVDATVPIDDVRAADFSIVALEQLYKEDGGKNEDLFLALNPLDWLDRRTQEVLPNRVGKFPDKTQLFHQYNMHGILMGNDTYGSYGNWDDKKYADEAASDSADATKYPDLLTYFQPGNEPPLDAGYMKFHNKISELVLAQNPNMKVIGPNTAFNVVGPNEQGMKDYIATCGKDTDVLNWHIYAVCPQSERAEVLYWSKYATDKLRTPGVAKVMFTEADDWNSQDSQFNYLMERAYTFLPMPQIVGTFQYCMDARSEGGTYRFGVLQPTGEMQANYSGYWIWRDLRGKLVSTKVSAPAPQGDTAPLTDHVHVLSSSQDGGKTVTVVAYYDTGVDPAAAPTTPVKLTVSLKLPEGKYSQVRSDAAWNQRDVAEVASTFSGTVPLTTTLAPCHATAFVFVRN